MTMAAWYLWHHVMYIQLFSKLKGSSIRVGEGDGGVDPLDIQESKKLKQNKSELARMEGSAHCSKSEPGQPEPCSGYWPGLERQDCH